MPAFVIKRKGHGKQIGNKVTKYTKNGAFGFFHWDYFFVDHEPVTAGAIYRFSVTGAFLRFAPALLLAGYPL
jgi:hypothetical protein